MKRRTAYFVGTSLFLLFLVPFGIFGCARHPGIVTHDSPITITGGTIHATSSTPWTRVNDQEYYTVLPAGVVIDQITTKHVSNVTSPTTVSQSGWAVMLKNRSSPAVEICSDEQCSYAAVTGQKIYVKIIVTNTMWEMVNSELHYHDNNQGCDTYPKDNHEGSCDYLGEVIIGDANHPLPTSLASGECRAFIFWGGHCKVGIGGPN